MGGPPDGVPVQATDLDIWDDPWGEIADAEVARGRSLVRSSFDNPEPKPDPE